MHAWVGWLWWLGPLGHVHRRYDVYSPAPSLLVQWRATKTLWPHSHIVMQIGNFWEVFGGDTEWLKTRLDLGCGRTRSGFGVGAGFPLADYARFEALLKTSNDSIVIWKQSGGYQGAVRRRTLFLATLGGASPANMGKWLSPFTLHGSAINAHSACDHTTVAKLHPLQLELDLGLKL